MNNEPIIILVAPNGAKKTKKDHPNIPLYPEEIANEALNCRKAGAVMMHLHVRDQNQAHTLDAATYKKAINAIKEKLADDLIIQVTSESVDIYKPQQQMAMVKELKPKAVSLAIRELIPDERHEKTAAEFFSWLRQNEIAPQFILYSPAEINYFADLMARKIIPQENLFVLFVLGKKNGPNIESAYAKPEDLHPFVEAYNRRLKSKGVRWAACAFGGHENKCMLEAVKLGGHVRIGFENNILLEDGGQAQSNPALVEQFIKSLPKNGRVPADVATAQKLLAIK